MILRSIYLKKIKWFYRDRGYFEAKSKNYNATIKRSLKEHTLGIGYILRIKRISPKINPWE
jgi:hypothetical protein